MDNTDTMLGVVFPPDMSTHQFLELDLRTGATATQLLGRRAQLHVPLKLVFKADDSYREHQSVFQLWADVQVLDQRGTQLALPERAVVKDPVYFEPDKGVGSYGDPWTRMERFVLDLDHRQLDDIETRRDGGSLTFVFGVGGTLYHDGRFAPLIASNHTLRYEVAASTWTDVLTQFGYGTYLSIEVPVARADKLTGEAQQAARALAEALEAFGRGAYEEAVADCRPGLEALRDADKATFDRKYGDREAGNQERFYWLIQAALTATQLAHHPNDPAASGDLDSTSASGLGRAEAETIIRMLATLLDRHGKRA